MANNLDILVWDDDFERIKSLYQRYPTFHIRRVINKGDFTSSLSESPTIIILGQQKELTPEELQTILETFLTNEPAVLIWFVGETSHELLMAAKEVEAVTVSGFSFENKYLWISIYNILRNG